MRWMDREAQKAEARWTEDRERVFDRRTTTNTKCDTCKHFACVFKGKCPYGVR